MRDLDQFCREYITVESAGGDDNVKLCAKHSGHLALRLAESERQLEVEREALRKASVSIDTAITNIFGWPWTPLAQRTYAECVSATQVLIKTAVARSESRLAAAVALLKRSGRHHDPQQWTEDVAKFLEGK